jgi:transposase
MSYSIDFRKKVMEYLDAGHTFREARETFRISMTAINAWRKKYKETGEIKDKPLRRHFKKLDPEKLKAYVSEHPDAYLKEIGEAFACSDTAVRKAFKRLGITHKKRQSDIGSKNRNR